MAGTRHLQVLFRDDETIKSSKDFVWRDGHCEHPEGSKPAKQSRESIHLEVLWSQGLEKSLSGACPPQRATPRNAGKNWSCRQRGARFDFLIIS